jgi:hypothetical protein
MQGGGPSGLVAAKTLLYSHPPGTFDPVIFEQHNTVGGLWPQDKNALGGLVNPEMSTNLSRYTVGFSDLAWELVNLDKGICSGGGVDSGRKPLFPKAWQVGRYLEAYKSKFLPKACVRTGIRVIKSERRKLGDNYKWNLTVKAVETDTLEECGDFDHVIVASGFFSAPFMSDTRITGLSELPNRPIHSSELRKLEHDLARSSSNMQSGRIVVVGGGMSGAEIASSLALQISSVTESGDLKGTELHKCSVHHVFPRPFWAVPLMLPTNPTLDGATLAQSTTINSTSPNSAVDIAPSWHRPHNCGSSGRSVSANPAPSFLSLDLSLYDLARRPPGDVIDQSGAVDPATAKVYNGYFEAIIGGDQQDIGEGHLHVTPEYFQKAYHVGLNDMYAEFVRSGSITTTAGYVTEAGSDEAGKGFIKIKTVTGDITIDNVATLVLATGFSPHKALEWLPADILQELSHDPSSNLFPILLDCKSTIHHSIPDLGFVGFYRGPFWGIMEMQSRFLGRLWSGDKSIASIVQRDDGTECMRSLKQLVQTSPGSVAPFSMGDYSGLMETFARWMGIRREAFASEERGGPVLPSRYLEPGSDLEQQQINLRSAESHVSASRTSGFAGRASFRAMQGTWNLTRRLTSALPTFPSGEFKGIASFRPRYPTDPKYDAEYLYVEEGTLTTREGASMRGSRRYVYRYLEATDKITVWFVKADNWSVDYFFHELEFKPHSEKMDGWHASGHHLCKPDNYNPQYSFNFRGVALEKFRVKYIVKGPKKDYVSDSWFSRH